jgi:hypothetical protein
LYKVIRLDVDIMREENEDFLFLFLTQSSAE